MAGNLSIAQTSRKEKQEAMMDTKTLVVGQAVSVSTLAGASYALKGTVVRVTPSGVEVNTQSGLFRFNHEGEEMDKTEGPWFLDLDDD
jgi:hypothetical protein